MIPGRQFEDRPSMATSYRTVHGQIREGQREITPELADRVLKEGVRVPDKNRPGHHVYVWTDPDSGDRFKVAHVPGSNIVPTVMRDEGGAQEIQAAEKRSRDQVRARVQTAQNTRNSKSAQEEKQARRDWVQQGFPGEFPGMAGYKAAKASAKKK